MTMSSPSRLEPRIGLVLSSGAARGAAHAGVLQVLERTGLPVSVVVGCSAGALVGAVWAAGTPADDIADRLVTATWADFGRVRPGLGLLDTANFRAQLADYCGHRKIETFPRRFGAVCTDLRTYEPVLLAEGDVSEAVSASIAVPGIFPPVRRGGRMLVDGALTSPTPVWAARQLGAEFVIAVRLRPLANGNSLRSRLRPRAASESAADVEFVIDTVGYNAWSARDVRRLVELGREQAEAAFSDNVLCTGP